MAKSNRTERPGDGTSLPVDSTVLRVANLENMDADLGVINVLSFELSTNDKIAPVPHLSTFEASLTTPEEALALTPAKDVPQVVCGLKAAEIRALKSIPNSDPNQPSLDVQWFAALVENGSGKLSADRRPGSQGHCGIVGLDWRFTNIADAKALRKSMRVQLRDLANKDRRLSKK